MDLAALTIQEFQAGIREKKFKAGEVVADIFRHIKAEDGKLGAYLALYEENAFRQAEEVDFKISAGETLPPLAGVPLAIKDNILIQGEITTAGSKILENYIAAYDAGVIKKLKAEEAVFIGKTNLDEFAMGTSTENSAFKITRNPRDPERVPGGSSGGSAVAVAANMALGALGSDTGGSIRQPAAMCGVVGLKPTYGAVSRSGLIAMASSLDQIGPITKTVADAEIIFKAIKGKDPMDATSVDYPEVTTPADIKQLTLGLPEEFFAHQMSEEVSKAMAEVIKQFENLGFKLKKVSLPHTKYGISAYYIIVPAEVSANLARFDGIRWRGVFENESLPKKLIDIYFQTRGKGFGPEPKRRIILGTFVLSSGYYDAYYAKAQEVRELQKQDFELAFEKVDVLLAPVTPNPAFKIGEKSDDPLSLYLEDVFTLPVNLAGLPAVSIPVKMESKLPVGFQLIGKHFREADILGLGKYYEENC
jgi:aspartyl-tRNA(Asn)/glutamyl-tRNA(Gln) amidotransferase subunit A